MKQSKLSLLALVFISVGVLLLLLSDMPGHFLSSFDAVQRRADLMLALRTDLAVIAAVAILSGILFSAVPMFIDQIRQVLHHKGVLIALISTGLVFAVLSFLPAPPPEYKQVDLGFEELAETETTTEDMVEAEVPPAVDEPIITADERPDLTRQSNVFLIAFLLCIAGVIAWYWWHRPLDIESPTEEASALKDLDELQDSLNRQESFGNVVVELYFQLTLRLRDSGFERDQAMSVQEFRRQLEQQGLPASPLRVITDYFELCRYSEYQATDVDFEKLKVAVADIQMVLKPTEVE